ncbi:MAG TPA: hypothetical protein VHM65_00560, partial [Candidatus Lustribacter sp.]|nr:hypothetical protein [Candidatus Lustribacter sp.]
MPTSARSLADDIRARSDVQLSGLVQARPDLARPAPSDLTTLAARASTRASVQQALAGLDRGLLDVLEGALAASDSTGCRPVSAREIAQAVGVRTVGEIRDHIDTLWLRAVLWRAADGLRAPRAVIELLGPTPNGLGPSAAELSGLAPAVTAAKARALRALLARAPDAASAVLDSLAWGPPIGVLGASPAAGEG